MNPVRNSAKIVIGIFFESELAFGLLGHGKGLLVKFLTG
ncbi:MAG: hypothetical protein UW66_C0018G0007 [Candidatus Moranbacteria bacterium GW2011_GWF1_44_4]|nr:MAG: hypothetical protein UW66_C0018G0007 [Candidatus Moranbacteria bacterium GW2011_GWF1_44_4]